MDQVEALSQGGFAADGGFSAVLMPHRSLGPNGFLFFMAVVSAVSFITGFVFYLAGAWPVMGFFFLDVLLIYLAFKLNYRAAGAYETVSISGRELTVTRVLASGRSNSWTLNPYWARVELATRPGRASRLLLTSHGNRLVVGSFLSESERREFAAALRDALAACKGGQAS
jgi:uncharacterized membrane protein